MKMRAGINFMRLDQNDELSPHVLYRLAYDIFDRVSVLLDAV